MDIEEKKIPRKYKIKKIIIKRNPCTKFEYIEF